MISKMATADVCQLYGEYSFEDLQNLTVKKLKEILNSMNESTSGKKASLVTRLYAKLCGIKAEKRDVSARKDETFSVPYDCTYTDLLYFCGDSTWTKDLRYLPEVNFHQLYEYLVVRTKKYGDKVMKGTVFKKERSYNFFKEGHVTDIQVCQNGNTSLVKARVVASMKSIKYKAIVVCSGQGDVMYAACECPAG